MSKEQILADLKTSVETWNIKLAQDATNAAINEGISIGEIIGDGLGKGMEVVGDRFDKAEIFLPQVVAASKTMEAALKILEPLMSKGEGALKERTSAAPCSAEPDTTSSTSDATSPLRTSSTPETRTRPRSSVDPL